MEKLYISVLDMETSPKNIYLYNPYLHCHIQEEVQGFRGKLLQYNNQYQENDTTKNQKKTPNGKCIFLTNNIIYYGDFTYGRKVGYFNEIHIDKFAECGNYNSFSLRDGLWIKYVNNEIEISAYDNGEFVKLELSEICNSYEVKVKKKYQKDTLLFN